SLAGQPAIPGYYTEPLALCAKVRAYLHPAPIRSGNGCGSGTGYGHFLDEDRTGTFGAARHGVATNGNYLAEHVGQVAGNGNFLHSMLNLAVLHPVAEGAA